MEVKQMGDSHYYFKDGLGLYLVKIKGSKAFCDCYNFKHFNDCKHIQFLRDNNVKLKVYSKKSDSYSYITKYGESLRERLYDKFTFR